MEYTIDAAEKFIREHSLDRKEYYPSNYHFMPRTGWINDPNGVCVYRGKYHLFYQYNPFDTVWNDPYWGHAVTTDFIRYTYLPVALSPAKDRSYGCFSGGAALTKEGRLALCYTRHYHSENGDKEEQFMAVSKDGISFEEKDLPILGREVLKENDSKSDFRDCNPVFIDGKYYLFVGSKDVDNVGQILVYKSENMSDFDYHMTIRDESFGSMLECPDMFRLEDKEIIVFSSIGYVGSDSANGQKHGSYALIGHIDFKNKTYCFDRLTRLDYGTDFYAPQTLETPDGRRIMFAWLNLWNNSAYMCSIKNNTSGRYTLPRELYLEKEELCVRPVREVFRYLGNSIRTEKGAVLQKNFYIKVEFRDGSRISFCGEDGVLEIGRKAGRLYLNSVQKNHLTTESILSCKEEKVVLDVFSDAGSLEVFTDCGKSISTQVLIGGDTLTVGESENVSIFQAKTIDAKTD